MSVRGSICVTLCSTARRSDGRAAGGELVKLFLERGADPIEADAPLWATPEAWARRMKHDDILAALEAHSR
jgi:hypothetical protein